MTLPDDAMAMNWLLELVRDFGCLLRTTILKIDEDRRKISFRGGGIVRSGVDSYDELHDYR